MVIKKKDGKDVEVQDGWKGHIIPFDLVQNTLLKTELDALKKKENRQAEITAEYADILDSLSEEEKEGEITNEAKDSFAAATVAKAAKQIKADLIETPDPESYEAKILKVADLFVEEKALKAQIKADADKLHLLTKTTIENLTDAQVHELLELKWITPLINSLHELPEQIVRELASKIQALVDKYATTYKEVVQQIQDTEISLTRMIDELTGNEYDMSGLAEFQTLLKGE
jgi:type I restriction enzyme M protein